MGNVNEQIEELKKLCYEYPPNLEKIDQVLAEVSDFHDFYYYDLGPRDNFVQDNADFLGNFIFNYFEIINEGWFGKYVYNKQTKRYDFIAPEILPELIRETYAPKIIELFLNHGYDMSYMSGLVGASCLSALVYSDFNDELVKVAKMLIQHGANPFICDEEGCNTLDTIEYHMVGLLEYGSCLEDDYLYNRAALEEFYDICDRMRKRRDDD